MKLTNFFALGIVFLTVFNCKTSKESVLQFQSTPPLEISAPYYNTWVAGVKGGGSGVNVFLPLIENGNIDIDSLHFRGEKSAVETRDKLIIGRFMQFSNQKKDLIMSSEPQDEYNNKLDLKREVSPFNLPQNACVISYIINGKRLYYKVSNLKKGESIAYPSAPPKNP
jgi:hypothetical protein